MRHSSLLLGGMSVVFLFWMAACGKSSSGSGTKIPGGLVSLVVQAANYGTHRGDIRVLAATNTNNGYNGTGGFAGLGMFSAAPLGMRVYLQEVALVNGGTPTVVYSSTTVHTTASGIPVTGCQLQLTTGVVDLSPCAGLSSLTIPGGTYTGMTVKFAEVGEIQGCVRGRFNFAATGTTGTYSYPSPLSATVSYTNDTLSTGTDYTYCTRSDQHYFQAETTSTTAIGNDSSYQPSNAHFTGLTVPDYVSIDLGSGNNQAMTMAQLKAGSVTLSSTAVPTGSSVTIAVDMNRMLEFFANARTDFNPPGPTMHTGTSYFFTSKFTPVGGAKAVSAVTVYGGTLGSIQGYQWTATEGGTGQGASGWYTLYLDASGNYLGGTMYEDDANALTIMKGNATLATGATTISASTTITMDIAGSLFGFSLQTTTGGAPGTATLTQSGHTYNVSYQRLL